jgi:hypothetical protein
MEEYFEDPSFVYYLIDNFERAMKDAGEDLEQYKDKVRAKTLKQYIKSLKEDLNNQTSLGVLKKLGSMFTMGKKKASIPGGNLLNTFIKEEKEEDTGSFRGMDSLDQDNQVKNLPMTLDALKKKGLPSLFQKKQSKEI